jgi:hypothetical protein
MKHYNLKTLQYTKPGFTDLFILELADWVKNATTAHVLTALAVGDIVYRVMSEVKTAVAGPTATVSVGVVGALTTFTDASDVATGTAVPYVAKKATAGNVGTGFIAATSGGAVTTALTNATSGVIPGSGPVAYETLTAVNMVANAILSNVTVTAGEVWIWAEISRQADRVIQVN